jgi:hypothetical protein
MYFQSIYGTAKAVLSRKTLMRWLVVGLRNNFVLTHFSGNWDHAARYNAALFADYAIGPLN